MNPLTHRCVTVGGKVHQQLVKQGVLRAPASSKGSKQPQNARSKAECTPNKIRSPVTHRCITVGGKVHQQLVKQGVLREKVLVWPAVDDYFETFKIKGVTTVSTVVSPANVKKNIEYGQNYIKLKLADVSNIKPFNYTQVISLNKDYQIAIDWNTLKHKPIFQLIHRTDTVFNIGMIYKAIRALKKHFKLPMKQYSLILQDKYAQEQTDLHF